MKSQRFVSASPFVCVCVMSVERSSRQTAGARNGPAAPAADCAGAERGHYNTMSTFHDKLLCKVVATEAVLCL